MVGHSHQAQIFNTIVGANKPMVRDFFQHPLHKGNANVLYVDRSDQPCWNIIFYVLKSFCFDNLGKHVDVVFKLHHEIY
jgi:prepilin-type processing-associated H-X9-DG protein